MGRLGGGIWGSKFDFTLNSSGGYCVLVGGECGDWPSNFLKEITKTSLCAQTLQFQLN